MSENKSKSDILQKKYRKVLEGSTVLSLLTVILLFYSFKSFKHENQVPDTVPDKIIVVPPPKTQQNKPKPPPSRPQIPIEAEDDELLDDVTINDTEIDFSNVNNDILPLPEEPDEIVPFYAVSVKPIIVKQAQAYYPELARKAQIEGTVTIKVLIDTKGNVERAEILKSIPMLNEAAMQAALKCKFKPAKQRDKLVKVWMSIPFKFSLSNRSM